MKTGSQKVIVKIAPEEQQNNIKNARKALSTIQHVDKENVIERGSKSGKLDQEMNEKIDAKRKKITNKSVQTHSVKEAVTIENLTSEAGPSEKYWEILAERRRVALDETLEENRRLHEKIAVMEEELKVSKEMVAEARSLVEVLTEMLQEHENQAQPKE